MDKGSAVIIMVAILVVMSKNPNVTVGEDNKVQVVSLSDEVVAVKSAGPSSEDEVLESEQEAQVVNFSSSGIEGGIFLYWEVVGGVGCCSTYNCDYDLFEAVCLNPFRLYDIAFDGVLYNWSTHDFENYTYTCGDVTPWNNFTYMGDVDQVTIYQKDCVDTVSTFEVAI